MVPLDADLQLTAYRNLLDNAQAMLQAASEERWDDLPPLDDERHVCLSSVMRIDSDAATHPDHAKTCTELIQAILASDRQTSALIKARQKELGLLLNSVDKEKKLANFYLDE